MSCCSQALMVLLCSIQPLLLPGMDKEPKLGGETAVWPQHMYCCALSS